MPEPIVYEPRGAARELFECRAPEVLVVGPAGTGKTRAVMEKVNALCWKYPRSRHLFLRQFRGSMNETVLVTWEADILGPQNPMVTRGAHRSHRQIYDYPNGSCVVLGGIDNAERFMSGQYDTISFFEATEGTQDSWETVLTRLRNNKMPYHQGIADCNPGAPGHWLNVRADTPQMVRLRSFHVDNPACTPQYLERLSKLTGVRRARYYEGKWVGAEGLVYEMFLPATHVRDGKGSRAIVAVDDGTRNPFAAGRIEQDGDGTLYVTAERYQSGLLEAAKVKAVRELADGAECIVVDPAAAGLKLALQSADGLPPVYDANNDVLMGIGLVQQRFGEAGLFISPTCTNLIRELQTYEWADNAKKDVPVKESDHCMDFLRYGVARYDGEADWGRLLAAQANPAERARPEQPRIGDTPPANAPAFVWPEAEPETWSM